MPGTSSINGVISGLQTDEIIAKLTELERAPIIRLEARKASLNAKLTAWQDINTRILALKTKADQLASGSTFTARTFLSSDESIIRGSASPGAQIGTYYLRVNSVARSHQLASTGYADTNNTRVGTGTITIQVGSNAPVVINIDDTNNTLTGLRDAINRSGANVTAAIINDGSEGTPYRLVITSKTSGTPGQVTIISNLSGGEEPTFTTIQAAQDASITLGEGENAITVTKSINTITDLIPGLTLNLQQAKPDTTVTLTVQPNPSIAKQAIKDFVEQYNNLVDFINQQFKFDPESNTIGGALFSDPILQSIHSELIGRVTQAVANLDQPIVVLSQVGITLTPKDNKLSLDETKLEEVLTENLDMVRRLFVAEGIATNNAISYISSTSATKPSGSTGYAIEITAVATQARVTAGVAQTEALAQDELLIINGVEIQLTEGMTPNEVVNKINEYSSRTGVIASRTGINGEGTGDYLTLTRIAYGSAPGISVVSNVSNLENGEYTSGIGKVQVTERESTGEAGTGTGAPGVDVAGTINGEPAKGMGQFLIGNKGNPNTEGLKILVSATTPGSYGTLYFTKGIGALLSDYLAFITEPVTGSLDSQQNELRNLISYVDDDIKAMEERVSAAQERLIAKFAAMESALGKLQTQSQFIMSQLSQISKSWKESK
jgi:flagellar hook-associated protein 2